MTRLAALALLLASCGPYDPGGGIISRTQDIARSPPVPLTNILCESACTMRLRRDCVGEGAVFMFHGPWRIHPPLSEQEFDHYSRVMAQYYPPALAEWFMREGRFGNHYLSGETLIERGWANAC